MTAMNEPAPAPPETPRWLHRYVVFMAICTLALVSAGGLVTSLGAGLSVPDWPTSFGGFNPPNWTQVQTVRSEHGHRLIATSVGILTIILCVFAWLCEPRAWVRRFSLLTLGVVILQGLLGGLTVLLQLPPVVSIGHALLGQTFFCIVVAMALFTSPGWAKPAEPVAESGPVGLRALSFALVAAVFLQLLLGAMMRHQEEQSGLAVTDFPLVYGRLYPRLDEDSVHNINVDRFGLGLPDVTAVQILIHYLHRVWAIVVCAIAALLGVRIFKRHINRAEFLFPILAIACLLVLQVVLGAWTVLSGKQPHVATAHVAVGALILAASVVLAIQSARLASPHAAALPAPSGSGALSAAREARP